MAQIAGLRQQVREKGYVLNGYCQMPGTFSAELYARQGWDAVTLDLQHGLIGYDTALPMVQAMAPTGVLLLARVPWLDPAIIMKLLDAGVLGVTCPMVNTAADAERLVQYCKYPPRGERSYGPIRAGLLYGSDYAARANEAVSVLAMVETAEAVENLDKILAVADLDGVYIGATDLALSMGRPMGQKELDPAVESAVEHVLQQCRKRGVIAGMIARDPDQAGRLVQRGFQFITLSSDMQALAGQARQWVQGCRAICKVPPKQ